MKTQQINPYTIDRVAGEDTILLMCNGAELATVESVEEAALAAAKDAISGFPEVTWDFMYDVLEGQMLANVVHMTWYRDALAGEIQQSFNLPTENRLQP